MASAAPRSQFRVGPLGRGSLKNTKALPGKPTSLRRNNRYFNHPACTFKGAGTAYRSSRGKFARDIRILGRDVAFLASVSFRGLPACPRKVVRRRNNYPEAGPTGDIRILGQLGVFIASVGFRELPKASAERRSQLRVGPNGMDSLKNPKSPLGKPTSLRGNNRYSNHPACTCKGWGTAYRSSRTKSP